MDEKELLLNINLGTPTRFDEYEGNYLRYEITKISGRKFFMSSSGWELSISNNELNETEKYSNDFFLFFRIFFLDHLNHYLIFIIFTLKMI